MLILSRKKNESIVINDNIEITIMEVEKDQVKIGIKAPKDVSIHRSEIYEKIKEQMQAAAKTDLRKWFKPTNKDTNKDNNSANNSSNNSDSNKDIDANNSDKGKSNTNSL